LTDLQSIKQRFGIIGNSPKLNRALEIATQVSHTNLSVLITGESGVGKEVFSQIIHQLSPRKHEGFIAVNCGAIPEGTIDSELFGHEKGAFTGAQGARKGYFESVNGGTIFLDEVGEMPLGTQARLLRVLEAGEFIKVGSSQVQKTDVRVLAATNVDMTKLIQEKKFREDLYYRLNTVPIHVPALRERKEDIYLLFRKFATDFADKYRSVVVSLDDDARILLENYPWQGNIRELKNIAEQVSLLSPKRNVDAQTFASFLPEVSNKNLLPALGRKEDSNFSEREILYKMLFDIKNDVNYLKDFIWKLAQGEKLDTKENQLLNEMIINGDSSRLVEKSFEYPTPIEKQSTPQVTPIVIEDKKTYSVENTEESLSLIDMEKDMIEKALEKHQGKRKNAALDLGISERTLYRKIKEYDIES
jgi:transcriptional regulator with PAS, ATPase and Fis domain